jgi:hypothetical protein
VEILSDAHRALPVREAAAAAYRTAATLLKRVPPVGSAKDTDACR